MTNADFVQEMRESLRKQKDGAALSIENKLHDAKVYQKEGARTWQKLRELVVERIKQINNGEQDAPLEYEPDGDTSFGVRNRVADRGLVVTFEPPSATIAYRGAVAKGLFRASVRGNALAYSWENTEPSSGVNVVHQTIGTVISIEKMGEILLRAVVNAGY